MEAKEENKEEYRKGWNDAIEAVVKILKINYGFDKMDKLQEEIRFFKPVEEK